MDDLNARIAELKGYTLIEAVGQQLVLHPRDEGGVEIIPWSAYDSRPADDLPDIRYLENEGLCMQLFDEMAEGCFVSLKTVEGGWSVVWADECDAHVMLDTDRRRAVCKAWIEWKEAEWMNLESVTWRA